MNEPILEIDVEGNKAWYLNGEIHREDGPAIEYVDGDKEWRLNGLLHREDGPAIEDSDGYKAWLIKGQYHRVDGPAIIIFEKGRRLWYLNNKNYSENEWFSKLTPEQQDNYLWKLDE